MPMIDDFDAMFREAAERKRVREEGKTCPTCLGWYMVVDRNQVLSWCDDPFHEGTRRRP